jgi:hypothetical protein
MQHLNGNNYSGFEAGNIEMRKTIIASITIVMVLQPYKRDNPLGSNRA